VAGGGMILAAVHDPLPIATDTLDLGGLDLGEGDLDDEEQRTPGDWP
jgi:hypothetical protein